MQVGVTQEMLAAELGMAPQNLARIEQGRLDVRVSTVARLANALGVEMTELLEYPKLKRVSPGRPRKTQSSPAKK